MKEQAQENLFGMLMLPLLKFQYQMARKMPPITWVGPPPTNSGILGMCKDPNIVRNYLLGSLLVGGGPT